MQTRRRKVKKYQILIFLWFVISIIGAFSVFSAGESIQINNGESIYGPLIEQIVVILIFVAIMGGVLRYFDKIKPVSSAKKMALPLYVLSIVLLVVVLIGGMIFPSFVAGGAKSIIPLGPLSFQPLEIYKIAMILLFASAMEKPKFYRDGRYILKVATECALGILLILIEPDLGGAMITGLLLLVLLIINGKYLKQLFTAVAAACAVFLGYIMFGMQAYQLARIEAWLDPFGAQIDKTQNLINSFIAISNGGLFGMGYLNSIQKTGYLYAANTDFIFAVICEEWGLIGGMIIIILLVLLSFQILNIASSANSRFGMLYCYGFGFLILIQSFVNIGGVIGFIPMTGVTLPFISKGLTSYSILTMGLILVICIDKERIVSRRRKRRENAKRT